MPGPDRSYYALSQETPFVALDCQKAFDGLNDKERLYAHYLSQASWYGSLIVLHQVRTEQESLCIPYLANSFGTFQTSPESPLIFLLLRKLLKHQPIAELKKIALEKVGLSEEEFKVRYFRVFSVFHLHRITNFFRLSSSIRLVFSSTWATTEDSATRRSFQACWTSRNSTL